MDVANSSSRLDIAPPALTPGAAVTEPDPFSRALLAAMLSFRDGDFAARMPSDITGLNGKIADAFNEIAALSERRARETARVSRAVGKEGKLRQRMSVPGVVGGGGGGGAGPKPFVDDPGGAATQGGRAGGAGGEGGV